MSLPNPEALYARLRDQIEKPFPTVLNWD